MRVIIIEDGQGRVGELTDHLRRLVLCDLTILAAQYREAGWDLKRPEEAIREFYDEVYALVVLPGDRLMMVSSGIPWFANDPTISEEWIGYGVSVAEAADTLRLLGRQFGATKFEVGTRATPGARHNAAARLYQRQGLRLSTNVLVGDIHE